MNFEWQTEGEQGWKKGEPAPERPTPSRWRRWLLLSLVLFVAGFALTGYRLSQLRIEGATREAEEGVLAAHRLLQTAVAGQDKELLRTVAASGADWRQLQSLTRSAGVGWLGPGPNPAPPQVLLSPDLQQATLTYTVPFTTMTPQGSAKRVQLVRSAVYRRQDEGWQWVAPEAAFWGEAITDGDQQLLFVYPERDRRWGERLAQDMRPQIERICALVKCPEGLRFQIRFERQPSLLAQPIPNINTRRALLTLSLPAPSLLGLPVDESGYQALLREYTTLLVPAIVDYLLPREWPEPAQYLAALERQLAVSLELEAWPPPATTPAPATIAQDVLLLCTQGLDAGAVFWRFVPRTAAWQQAFRSEQAVRMAPLPDDSGIFFQEENLRQLDHRPQTWLWRPDQQRVPVNDLFLLGTTASPPRLHAARLRNFYDFDLSTLDGDCTTEECELPALDYAYYILSPDERYLLFRYTNERQLYLEERQSGEQRQVAPEAVYPFWINETTYGYLETSHHPGDLGWNYQIVVQEVGGEQKAVLATREDLTSLIPAERQTSNNWPSVGSILLSPERPDSLFVFGGLFQRYESSQQPVFDIYLSTLNRQTGSAVMSFYLQDVQIADSPQLSPDGRWLAFSGYNPETMNGALYLYDLLTEDLQKIPFESRYPYLVPVYDWSADGQWLLILDEGLLELQAPATGEAVTVVPPLPGCSAAAWQH